MYYISWGILLPKFNPVNVQSLQTKKTHLYMCMYPSDTLLIIRNLVNCCFGQAFLKFWLRPWPGLFTHLLGLCCWTMRLAVSLRNNSQSGSVTSWLTLNGYLKHTVKYSHSLTHTEHVPKTYSKAVTSWLTLNVYLKHTVKHSHSLTHTEWVPKTYSKALSPPNSHWMGT